ncbi:hypothetical protein WOLCODRAFT_156598 [Wolfiporia cocos MD-104 SS10]|uniref:Uncharacterized protein n=1 Tax=Wolfiporia cocos (strain MD-104) TaxID=742152 RepID=A0A2H3JE00_WOLCO|nr:hypothetical protein WOLCODRAFT_156598 [Wolfiporia cocos MD-104 SS10]
MSDNQLMNTANRMIARAVAALRVAPESMEGEDYTQWQTKFMEELAFNMGNFPYKVFELRYRLPELYGSMVAEYTQVRNDGEESNKIRIHKGDARIASIQNLAPTVDPTRPLPVVEDLGPNQWWTADNTLAEAEGSSTAQPATRKRGREDSEEESTEKEGGKDGGLGGDEEEGTGRGGSEDEEQGLTSRVTSLATVASRVAGLATVASRVTGLVIVVRKVVRLVTVAGQVASLVTPRLRQLSLVPKKIEDGEFMAITGQEVYVIACKFQKMYEDEASLPDNFNDLKVVCYDAEENDFIFDKRTLLSRKEKTQIATIVAEKNAATQAGHRKQSTREKPMEQDASNSEEDEENEEDQMGREEEAKSGGAETDGSVAAAFQRLRHDDDTEMDGEVEAGPSAGPSTTQHADKGKQVPRRSTRVAERRAAIR